MPRYDFRCSYCERVTEVVLPLEQSDARVTCPLDKHEMVKLPSAPGFVVHGFNAKNGYSKEV